jgi:hypothetical protein
MATRTRIVLTHCDGKIYLGRAAVLAMKQRALALGLGRVDPQGEVLKFEGYGHVQFVQERPLVDHAMALQRALCRVQNNIVLKVFKCPKGQEPTKANAYVEKLLKEGWTLAR